MADLTPWHKGPLLAFDFESTGKDPSTARPVTACVVVIGETSPGQIHARDWLMDAGVDIPAEATAIHGVSTEQVRADGQPARRAIVEILGALALAWDNGWPLIGHNVGYDLTLLDCELARHDLPGVEASGGPGLVVDTLCLDRMVDRYRRGKRTLEAACEHYKVALDGAHDAAHDAIASARIAWRIAELYPDLVQIPLPELMRAQAAAHREWAIGFQQYLDRKAAPGEPAERIDLAWPLRTLTLDVAAS